MKKGAWNRRKGLFVYGERDTILIKEFEERFEGLLKQKNNSCEYYIVPNGNHTFTSIKSEKNVINKTAEWLDKKKEKLRIYWKSLEAWADAIVDWAHNNAYTEPLFVQDIISANETFSNLPQEDIVKVFNIIDKNGQGSKTKLKNGDLVITINF